GEIGKLISWGPGPRASQALMLAVRARALLDGRFAPSVDDVFELAEPVLKHRMALTFAARAEGETIPNVIPRPKARIRYSRWRKHSGTTPRPGRYDRRRSGPASSPTPCRGLSLRHAVSHRRSFTACTAAVAPDRARTSGSTGASSRVSPRRMSTGGVPRATIIF